MRDFREIEYVGQSISAQHRGTATQARCSPATHTLAAILETDEAVDVTLDGEIRTHTPVVVRVAPHRLRVLVAPEAKYLLTQDGHPDSARS